MDAPVVEGEVLDGKYRVERVLGVGGMGVVVAAMHLQLDQRVALKFLLPAAMANPDVVARFAREARSAAKIKSEHVARVIDVGTMTSGAPYMVMEYLEGRDLAEVLRAGGALSIEDAVDYLLQACEAIAEAHVAGIVHRDLKPGNLFLSRRADGGSIVKVLDFGISKSTGPGAPDAMTKTTAVMGSPLYMSPEQLKSSRYVDARSDIWALGIILHELATGSVPYQAETMPQLCAMILSEPPPPLRQVRPDAPPGVEDAILQCLQQDPDARFPDVGALAMALLPFGSGNARISADRIVKVLGGGMPPPPRGPSNPAISMPPKGTSTQAAWTDSRSRQSSSFVSGPTQLQSTTGGGAATPARSKAPLFAALGALSLIVIAGTVWLTTRTATAPTTMASAPVAPVSAPSAVEPQIALVLRATPSEAKIFVDDAAVGQNPYSAHTRRDGTSHRVRVEAPGFETETRFVVFDGDVDLDIKLATSKGAEDAGKSKTAAPANPGAAAPPPRRKMYDNPW